MQWRTASIRFVDLFIVLSTLIQVCYARKRPSWRTKSKPYLLALNNRVHHDSDLFLSNIDFPPGVTRNNTKPLRKRGRKGGVRQRLRKMKYKPPLPSMIRSLKGLKMDELRANATFFSLVFYYD